MHKFCGKSNHGEHILYYHIIYNLFMFCSKIYAERNLTKGYFCPSNRQGTLQLSSQVRLPIPCFHTYATKSCCLQQLCAKQNIIRNAYIPKIMNHGFHRCRYPYHVATCSTVTTFSVKTICIMMGHFYFNVTENHLLQPVGVNFQALYVCTCCTLNSTYAKQTFALWVAFT